VRREGPRAHASTRTEQVRARLTSRNDQRGAIQHAAVASMEPVGGFTPPRTHKTHTCSPLLTSRSYPAAATDASPEPASLVVLASDPALSLSLRRAAAAATRGAAAAGRSSRLAVHIAAAEVLLAAEARPCRHRRADRSPRHVVVRLRDSHLNHPRARHMHARSKEKRAREKEKRKNATRVGAASHRAGVARAKPVRQRTCPILDGCVVSSAKTSPIT
jgi:hypothetical protein